MQPYTVAEYARRSKGRSGMHNLSFALVLVLFTSLGCAKREPVSASEPTPAPPAKPPPPAPAEVTAVTSARAIVTGVLVRRGDHIEICRGHYRWNCPGIRVEGKVEDAWISEDSKVDVWRLSGFYDGSTLVLDGPAQPLPEPEPSSISRAELEHLRIRAEQILRRQGVVWSIWHQDLVLNRITYEAEAIDAAARAELARETRDAIRVLAFIELVDHGLAQMPVPPARGDIELLTRTSHGGGGRSALGRFTVHYDAALHCVYFGTPDGRMLPYWPFGYWATSSPFTVYDYHGEVVAHEGDTIEIAGGMADIEHARADNPCGATQVWFGRLDPS
jgi:hypothetical protein